jgi:hypothetical protein
MNREIAPEVAPEPEINDECSRYLKLRSLSSKVANKGEPLLPPRPFQTRADCKLFIENPPLPIC